MFTETCSRQYKQIDLKDDTNIIVYPLAWSSNWQKTHLFKKKSCLNACIINANDEVWKLLYVAYDLYVQQHNI